VLDGILDVVVLIHRNGPQAMTASLNDGRVGRFYDENTTRFLSLGQGTEGTIHRAVWGPGVTSRVHAMAYVDGLIMERLGRLRRGAGRDLLRVADLGCGVGASLCRMAKQLPMQGIGFTISDAQVELGQRRIAEQGLSGSVECRKGDFCALPADIEPVDLAFSIEAFVHAPSGADYFRECARLVRPGGYLVVCDDFISAAGLRSGHRASRWIERFSRGWVAGNLETEEEAHALAREAGFSPVETIDLTPYLEIRRPRDYAAGVLMRCLGWLPVQNSYWLMLYGGHAAQICLKRGWIKHSFVVWRRDESAGDREPGGSEP
jgi:SAM-dependent methyltransferase